MNNSNYFKVVERRSMQDIAREVRALPNEVANGSILIRGVQLGFTMQQHSVFKCAGEDVVL